jgi:hypothetical protein
LTFFLTLATAVVGGVATLGASPQLKNTPVVDVALAALLMLGALIYIRMIHRNRTTDHLKEMADYIWGVAVELCPDLKSRSYKLDWITKTPWSKWMKAGYAETVGVVDSLLLLFLCGQPHQMRYVPQKGGTCKPTSWLTA